MFAATDRQAESFGEALRQQVRLFPELGLKVLPKKDWVKEVTGSRPAETRTKAESKDFIACNCGNVTLRIQLSEKQTFVKEEPERLMESGEFTSCTKGEYTGPRGSS